MKQTFVLTTAGVILTVVIPLGMLVESRIKARLSLKKHPKLRQVITIEAIAELQKDKGFEPTTADHVKTFLAEVPTSSAAEKEVTARIKLFTTEDERNILFETRDLAQKGAGIHRNYIRK
jgi:hypothetical protein